MKEPTAVKRWKGSKPVRCQICNEALTLENGQVFFVDFKTNTGLWAIGCIKCFQKQGGHIGVGYGQKYRLGDLTQVTGK